MEGSCANGVLELYDHIMTTTEHKQIPDPEHCKPVLLAVYLARRPLFVTELTGVAGLPRNIDPVSVVEKCGLFRVTEDGEVNLIHPSIKDYLEKNFRHPPPLLCDRYPFKDLLQPFSPSQ
jgi:hypothetical protein